MLQSIWCHVLDAVFHHQDGLFLWSFSRADGVRWWRHPSTCVVRRKVWLSGNYSVEVAIKFGGLILDALDANCCRNWMRCRSSRPSKKGASSPPSCRQWYRTLCWSDERASNHFCVYDQAQIDLASIATFQYTQLVCPRACVLEISKPSAWVDWVIEELRFCE